MTHCLSISTIQGYPRIFEACNFCLGAVNPVCVPFGDRHGKDSKDVSVRLSEDVRCLVCDSDCFEMR